MEQKVSIIIPVYNVDRYVGRCLDSVVNQTYKNIEIIIVNDGSTDHSIDICKEYANKDERINLITQKNKGLSGARNTGIEHATGDYLCFVDSDDWLELDYVSFAMNIICEEKVSLIGLGYYNSNDNVSKINHKGWIDKQAVILDRDEAMKLLVEDIKINSHAWDKVYSAHLFQNVRFPEGKNYEDIFIMHDIFNSCDKIAISSQPKYHYYCRDNSIARDYKSKNILDYFESEFKRLEFLKDNYSTLVPLQNTKLMELLLSYYPKFSEKGDLNKEDYSNYKEKFVKYSEVIVSVYNQSHEDFTNKKFKAMYKVFCLNRKLFKVISPIANEGIQKVKNSKYKSRIKAELSQSIDFKKTARMMSDKKKYVLIGIPEYDNLGDVAIGYAEIQYLKNQVPAEFDLLVVTENNFWKYFLELKKCITKDDVIFIQGGGNFGNQYYDQERIRRKVIKTFKNLIVLMPSTFYMLDWNKNIKQYSKLYNRNNIALIAREKYSCDLMEKAFTCKTALVPDIVLSLPSMNFKNNRSGIGLCLRNDVESKLSLLDKIGVKEKLFNLVDVIFTFDTCINMPVKRNEQEEVLQHCWEEISKYKLVITDKLHAMIFCALTGTPCIALGNYNHKISGVYKWIEELDYITYLENIDDIDNIVRNYIEADCQYNFKRLLSEFKPLEKIIKGEWK